MKHISTILLLVIIISTTSTSCEHEYEDTECTCPQGGVIGGWEEPSDTTVVNKKDTTGGFEVSLEDWRNTETHDISI